MTDTLNLIRWDDYSIPVNFTNSDGTPYDLTGSTVRFTVKLESWIWTSDDVDAKISKTITSHTDATNWVTNLVLSHTDTNIPIWEYVYDLQITTPWNSVHSSITWYINILQDVTKTITL